MLDAQAGIGAQQQDSGCVPMSDQGVLCSFTKNVAGKDTGLIIVAATDEKNSETSVFFLRAEGLDSTPSAAQPTTQSQVDLSSLQPVTPITVLPHVCLTLLASVCSALSGSSTVATTAKVLGAGFSLML